MKKLPLVLLTSTLTAMMTAQAETVVFDDAFGGSTLNNATPADPDATSTAYQLLSAKSWSGQSIAGDQLRIGMVGTSSGIMECQALFTTNPVTLDVEYDAIELRVTFTNTAGLLSAANGQLSFGLYNSGGLNGSVKPVPGGLQGTLASSQSGAAVGNAQNWQGYFGQMFYDGGNHRIATREVQSGTDNRNQATATSGTSSSPGNPAPADVGPGVPSTLVLTVGATYTEVLTITRNGDSSLAITNSLYAGPEPSGAVLATAGGTATNATYLTGAFDSLSIGWRATGGAPTTMDVSKLTVTKYTVEDLPALYNVQLNGFTGSTFSGAARIGGPGDLWNNPDWVGVPTGSTNLFTGVSILDSAGADLGVTATMTAAYNNNTTDWNDGGVFNHYTSQTAGSATPVLMDQLVKVDYSGSVNVMTLSFSGLPASKLVTAYVYGVGNGDGQGSTWSLGAANGGDSASVVYDESATGRDVSLNSSKGTGWESLAGSTDGSGNLTVIATAGNGSIGWQTYLNGLQLQVGGTAPTIIGLTDQTVEDGTTVVLSPVVTGNPPPTYQWQENGIDMPGETDPTLTLESVTTNQSGFVYSLVADNPLGTVTNSMTLTVNASVYSDMSVTSTSPTNGATGLCLDTPLAVTFSDTVTLGTIGSIKIFEASNPDTPVDTIDAADGLVQQRFFPGDGQSFSYPTISIDGNTVTINPHFNVLAPDQTYYGTIDPKTFLDSGGTNFVGLADTNAWRFSTKPGPADPNHLVVNGDCSGDFLTVQGAVNSVPNGNTTPRTIHIRDGLYKEIVNISGKHNLTLRGQSRLGTRVGFANNSAFQAANGGTTHARMSFKVNANDIAVESLTLTNMTAQGGGQAEALMLESGASRFIMNNATVSSRQDTILANVNTSQGYFYNSRVEGNFDYIWGGGNLFFSKCEIRTISGSSGFNLTAARTQFGTSSSTGNWETPDGTKWSLNGFSFVNCRFEKDAGVSAITVAGRNGTAGGCASWINCQFDTAHRGPASDFDHTGYNFWQYGNTDLSGTAPVVFADVVTLTNGEARMLAAIDAETWLYGWVPRLLPNILEQPVDQTALGGEAANFAVSATGIPEPTYQWTHGGTNLVGETNATLSIADPQLADAGEYTVEVSNAAGTVTSVPVTLTVSLPITTTDMTVLSEGVIQLSITGNEGQPYRIWAGDDLMLTPVTNTWTLLDSGTFGLEAILFSDPSANNFSERFYTISAP